jgi:NAD(P)-dependent dehydrogenase (short-subunit alcohol dehydrogenase family)
MPNNAFLITGANAGLGKDVARQLGLRADVDSIYLACRDQAKAEAAQADLQRITGRPVFEVLIMDTANLASVRAALTAINQPLRAVLLNAGGTGGPTPMARTAEGATTIFASNVLGHAVLLEGLLDAGLLTSTAVLTGSEAARGVPKLRMKRPAFASRSVEEFASVIDGSFFGGRKVDPMLAYGQVKYLGALWMCAGTKTSRPSAAHREPGKHVGHRRAQGLGHGAQGAHAARRDALCRTDVRYFASPGSRRAATSRRPGRR